MATRILIFDTTLRDGEQSPGYSMNTREKLELARQLARLRVDVIEAGFPIASPDDFEAVKVVSQNIREGITVAGLCRTRDQDIDRAWEALQHAERPRIHTFIATSTIHIPDTVGYAMPWEYGERICTLMKRVPNIDTVIVSAHCHNDLGLAVSNSLEGIRQGVRQAESTINGIGERAGNASLEEIVMTIRTRRDLLNVETGVNTEEIYKTSKLLTTITGVPVQPNKAIVGANAFAHEAGIHQHGMLSHALTYEIMTPQSVGVPQSRLVLGKHSGRHALKKRLQDLGVDLNEEDLNRAFVRFKELCDKKKEVFDDDLLAIVEEQVLATPETYVLEHLQFASGTNMIPTATIRLKKQDEIFQESGWGDGPVDATFKAIDQITGIHPRLKDYSIRAVTSGKDALGEVMVSIEVDGQTVIGRGTSTDVIEASAKAYLNAINRVVGRQAPPAKEVRQGV